MISFSIGLLPAFLIKMIRRKGVFVPVPFLYSFAKYSG
jgi:hypothetical protein